jgi:hypothetical protein
MKTTPDDYHCWLDRIIEEQAKHYGMGAHAFGRLMSDAATAQEQLEHEQQDNFKELEK